MVCVVLLAACGSSSRHEISAAGAWVRFTPVNAAAYVTISNTTADADALVSASVPSSVADKVEIHQTTTSEGDMMGMTMTSSVDLPASFTLTMKPGGYHFMLTGVHGAPVVGTTVPLMLTFAHHAPITVYAEVRA